MTEDTNPRAVPGANQLRDYIQRLCNVEEEIAERRDDLKELYKEAKGNGFEVAALRAIVKREREDESKKAKRQELEAMIDTYSSALGITW